MYWHAPKITSGKKLQFRHWQVCKVRQSPSKKNNEKTYTQLIRTWDASWWINTSTWNILFHICLHTDLCWSKSGEDTVETFFSFLLAEEEDLGLDLRFGDLLDFLGEGDGDNLDLTTSGEILRERKVVSTAIIMLVLILKDLIWCSHASWTRN